MPTYEYRCRECGHEFDAVQAFSDDPLTECPECHGELRKKFGAVAISFKGSGFYKNDARSSGTSSSTSPSSSSSASKDTSDSGDSPSSGDSNGSSGTSGVKSDTSSSDTSSSNKTSSAAKETVSTASGDA